MLPQPERDELTVMATPHLHNFFRRSTHSVGIWAPPDTFDHEIEGNLLEGRWRNMVKGNMTSLLPTKTIPCGSASDAKEVGEEVAKYCVNKGHMSWQDIHK
jgi:hypothetical protein